VNYLNPFTTPSTLYSHTLQAKCLEPAGTTRPLLDATSALEEPPAPLLHGHRLRSTLLAVLELSSLPTRRSLWPHQLYSDVANIQLQYATGNQVQSTDGQRLTKIDRENEVAPPKTIDKEVGKAMSKARGEKTPPMTQKDLATKVNEKPSVINDYESGRAVPNQQVLAKLERALGVKLRGKGRYSWILLRENGS
jgi:DNA-binding XRE family transcriptional regulator